METKDTTSNESKPSKAAAAQSRAEELFAAHLDLIRRDIPAWLGLFTDDAVIEFPYAPSIGTPERLEGKRAIAAYMKDVPSQMLDLTFTGVRVYPTVDPNVLLAEAHGEATIASTGRRYAQDYVMKLETDGAHIIRYREYWNPADVSAFGSADALQNLFGSSAREEQRGTTIVIAAASGNIGRRAAEQVIKAGARPVLLTRHPESLADLAGRGAVIKQVDITDTAGLIEATRGAGALFWLTPPNLRAESLRDWCMRTVTAAATAVRENRIKRVVNISSVGAGARPGMGTLSFAGEVEGLLNDAAESIVHLRPGYFMENFFGQIEAIRRDGAVYFPYAPDHDMPWISTDDIGDAAARYLLDPAWSGKWTRSLMGPENLTLAETAAILSRALGRDVRYVRVTIETMKEQLASIGATPDVQRELGDLFRALGDPDGIYATARTPEAQTPTTFEAFATQKLLPAIQSERREGLGGLPLSLGQAGRSA